MITIDQKLVQQLTSYLSEREGRLGVTPQEPALWDYVRVLEGSVTELFQRLSQVGLDQWQPDLLVSVDALKAVLDRHLTALSERLRPLQKWRPTALQKHVSKTKELLSDETARFRGRYVSYGDLRDRAQIFLQKFENYSIFLTLDLAQQENFQELYLLLRLFDMNAKARLIPQEDIDLAISRMIVPARALGLFQDYYGVLKRALFDLSRKLKEEPVDAAAKYTFVELLLADRAELHTLGATIGKYRDYLLRSDPNPYVRGRLGEEPDQAKTLLQITYDVELIDSFAVRLVETLKKGPEKIDYGTIEEILHDMEQPLISKHLLNSYGEALLKALDALDELGSFDAKVVEIVEDALLRAMAADWKYQTLHEKALFHTLYSWHINITNRGTPSPFSVENMKPEQLLEFRYAFGAYPKLSAQWL